MNRLDGSSLDLRSHIAQSCQDILTTPIGTRLARREYGSLLPELIDQPQNDATRLRVYAATVMALMRWEPRIRLAHVHLSTPGLHGAALLELTGVLVDDNQPLSLRVALNLGGRA
ncbi:GPW/gp25 family protein [Pseudomonas cremoricolorata]|uniref:GPW/gp25 family protein n=1 Tax=Pseudomonas cremoricolorata TaxID=157783 RepID=UPI0003FFDCF8|nr:GPW/gp25 family protein [Pseudomonas cremoricolorata]